MQRICVGGSDWAGLAATDLFRKQGEEDNPLLVVGVQKQAGQSHMTATPAGHVLGVRGRIPLETAVVDRECTDEGQVPGYPES